MDKVVSSAKTDMFRVRINPEVRKALANLMKELKTAQDDTESYSEAEVYSMFGVNK